MRFCARSTLRISNAAVVPTGTDLAQLTGPTGWRERGGVRQPFDARLQLHEGAELRHPRHAAAPHLAHLVGRAHGAPRIVLQLLQPERNLPRALVHAQHLDGDLIAARDHLARRGGARPAHFGYVKKALDAATQVDEGAEVEHRRHPARQHRARHDRLADGRRARLLFLFELFPPRDDDGLAAVLVLDDPERVGLAYVHRGVGGADDVDLRERTEGTLARDAHLVASLVGALDLAFHREPGLECVLQLALRRGIAHALARQRDAATGRDDDGLNAIADRTPRCRRRRPSARQGRSAPRSSLRR